MSLSQSERSLTPEISVFRIRLGESQVEKSLTMKRTTRLFIVIVPLCLHMTSCFDCLLNIAR